MIDSVGIFIPEASAPVDRLSDLRPVRCGVSGNLNGIHITQGLEGLYIKGSLPKFLTGGNALPLTRTLLADSLDKLEIDSGLDLSKGLLYQFEVGTSLSVKTAPANYLAAWGPLSRFKKHVIGLGETVTYIQKCRSFSGYDKGLEVKPNMLPLPLYGCYVIRLELRIKKGVKRFFGRSLTPWELTNPDIYIQTVKGWVNFYNRIPKRREVCLTMSGMTPKKFERTLAAVGLSSLGLDRANEIIRGGVQTGDIDKVSASRIRALLKHIYQEDRITDTEPLTAELDSKVRAVAMFAR